MDAREAQNILGLSSDATVEDVDRRYREMMLREHPDIGGDSERAIQLNLARTVARRAAELAEIAAAKADEARALAAQKAARRKAAKLADEKQPLGSETREMVHRLQTDRTGPVAMARNICGIACLICAAIAFFSSPGIAPAVKFFARSYLWTILFGLLAFIFACCTSLFAEKVRQVRRRIDALTDLLETPSCLRAVTQDILMGVVGRAPLGRKKLEEEVERAARQSVRTLSFDPAARERSKLTRAHFAAIAFASTPPDKVWLSLFPGLAGIFGGPPKETCDFGRIVVARGLEGGFVREQRSVLRGEAWTGYVMSSPTMPQPAPVSL